MFNSIVIIFLIEEAAIIQMMIKYLNYNSIDLNRSKNFFHQLDIKY